MASIEPGEEFVIEYGKSHRITVVALNGRQRLRCLKLMANLQGVGKEGFDAVASAMEELESCTRLCSPSITEEQLLKLDDELMGQIIVGTLAKNAISEDDEKKSE
jgi:hypothetical protein